MASGYSLHARALGDLPEVRRGDDLAALIATAAGGGQIRGGQLIAIAHKAVSKAEGAVVALADVAPGERALELAAELDKDPRAVQVVL
ncbi:MAG: coenzyme F420-0:L-glutamate ligase, partial [Solirubrobacteraceae bacterium]